MAVEATAGQLNCVGAYDFVTYSHTTTTEDAVLMVAEKEGIVSILSVPIVMHRKLIGALRVYTSEPWELTLEDVSFVQALAQLAGMAIEMSRLYQGQKEVIDILKGMRKAA